MEYLCTPFNDTDNPKHESIIIYFMAFHLYTLIITLFLLSSGGDGIFLYLPYALIFFSSTVRGIGIRFVTCLL